MNRCREAFPTHYIKLSAYDSTLGRQTTALSFLVNRPQEEPGFRLDRLEVSDRRIQYRCIPTPPTDRTARATRRPEPPVGTDPPRKAARLRHGTPWLRRGTGRARDASARRHVGCRRGDRRRAAGKAGAAGAGEPAAAPGIPPTAPPASCDDAPASSPTTPSSTSRPSGPTPPWTRSSTVSTGSSSASSR